MLKNIKNKLIFVITVLMTFLSIFGLVFFYPFVLEVSGENGNKLYELVPKAGFVAITKENYYNQRLKMKKHNQSEYLFSTFSNRVVFENEASYFITRPELSYVFIKNTKYFYLVDRFKIYFSQNENDIYNLTNSLSIVDLLKNQTNVIQYTQNQTSNRIKHEFNCENVKCTTETKFDYYLDIFKNKDFFEFKNKINLDVNKFNSILSLKLPEEFEICSSNSCYQPKEKKYINLANLNVEFLGSSFEGKNLYRFEDLKLPLNVLNKLNLSDTFYDEKFYNDTPTIIYDKFQEQKSVLNFDTNQSDITMILKHTSGVKIIVNFNINQINKVEFNENYDSINFFSQTCSKECEMSIKVKIL
jgi:hypothetical protein